MVKISIHALLAESDMVEPRLHPGHGISIHALLAESDVEIFPDFTHLPDFYPRSPCGERPVRYGGAGNIKTFLSTLSLRRATHTGDDPPLCDRNFYPRSPCGERPVAASTSDVSDKISIHALLAESDLTRYLINAR